MARAKRTDRAEARRQYRAYLAAQAEAEAAAAAAAAEADEEEETPAPAPARGFGRRALASSAAAAVPATRSGNRAGTNASARAAAAATPARTGAVPFFKAIGVAYKQINYRDDLRFLPTLILRTHAVWPGALLAIASTVVMLTEKDPKTSTLASFALLALPPMPLIPAMLAGLFAPKAAWLAGGVVGLVAGIGVWIILAVTPSGMVTEQTTSTSGAALYLMGSAITFGVLFGALSAWYKRFLQLIMPPKPPQSARSSRSKRPAARPGAKATAKPAAAAKPAATVKVAPKPGPAKR